MSPEADFHHGDERAAQFNSIPPPGTHTHTVAANRCDYDLSYIYLSDIAAPKVPTGGTEVDARKPRYTYKSLVWNRWIPIISSPSRSPPVPPSHLHPSPVISIDPVLIRAAQSGHSLSRLFMALGHHLRCTTKHSTFARSTTRMHTILNKDVADVFFSSPKRAMSINSTICPARST